MMTDSFVNGLPIYRGCFLGRLSLDGFTTSPSCASESMLPTVLWYVFPSFTGLGHHDVMGFKQINMTKINLKKQIVIL